MNETSDERAERVRANLPGYLKQSPEKIAEDKRATALRAASFTRARLMEEERVISRGMQYEEIALSNLPLARHAEDVEQESIRLAYGYELQGRYLEAADCHPMEEEKARLRGIDEAIRKDDSVFCDCAGVEHQGIEIKPHYEVKKIYSRVHGKIVSLVGCKDCPELNATPTPPEQLARILNAHRSNAARPQADVQVLM